MAKKPEAKTKKPETKKPDAKKAEEKVEETPGLYVEGHGGRRIMSMSRLKALLGSAENLLERYGVETEELEEVSGELNEERIRVLFEIRGALAELEAANGKGAAS